MPKCLTPRKPEEEKIFFYDKLDVTFDTSPKHYKHNKYTQNWCRLINHELVDVASLIATKARISLIQKKIIYTTF